MTKTKYEPPNISCRNSKREETRLSLLFSNFENNKKLWLILFGFLSQVDATKETKATILKLFSIYLCRTP
jgi:hypothetical protein